MFLSPLAVPSSPSFRRQRWAAAAVAAAAFLSLGADLGAQAVPVLRVQPSGLFLELPDAELPDARFGAERGAMGVRVQDDGLVLELRGAEARAEVALLFEGGQTRVTASGAPATRVSILRGADPSQWVRDAKAHQALLWRGLPGGVEVELHTRAGRLEYDVRVPPGAALGDVVLRCEGALSLTLDAEGRLVARTPAGPLVQDIPAAWQTMPDGTRAPVAARFVLLGAGRFGFAAPGRDASLPLVVDPGLSYGSYLGGALRDEVLAVADAGDGRVLLAGFTTSADFPVTPGAHQGALAGYGDAFVARLDTASGQLEWATFLGGTDGGFLVGEGASAVAAGAGGSAFVAGWANSGDFPSTPGAYQPTARGGIDAFVARFDAAGSLVWSSFLGGGAQDRATALGLAADGVVVAGHTASKGVPVFPTTSGAYDTSFNSIFSTPDGFVSKLSLDGSTLLWSTFLGGVLRDEPRAVAVAAGGAVTVAGFTGSVDFPATPGAYDESYNGPTANDLDAFVARLSADGSALEWSTLLGGAGVEEAHAVALAPDGTTLVAGRVQGGDFPVTAGAVQPAPGGGEADGFLARFSADGSQLLASSFLGGGDDDSLHGIAVDAFGAVTVAGLTRSDGLAVTADAAQPARAGGADLYVARLPADVGSFRYASYLGGAGDEASLAMALDAHGAALLAGSTTSTDLPLTPGAVDTSYAGAPADAGDGFVLRLGVPPWFDVGFAKLGSNGLLPRLVGAGSLEVGSPGTLTLTRARPSAVALLFAGFTAGQVPFKGGVLVPFPAPVTIVVVTFPDGSMPLGWAAWPGGLPPGFSVFMQFWITDPALESGLSASNALQAVQP